MDRNDRIIDDRPAQSTWGTLAYLLFGPLLWACQFTVVYGGHTLACSVAPGNAWPEWIVHGATVAVLAALIAFLVAQRRFAAWFGQYPDTDGRRGLDRIARIAAALSGVAILWTGAAAFILDACVQGR